MYIFLVSGVCVFLLFLHLVLPFFCDDCSKLLRPLSCILWEVAGDVTCAGKNTEQCRARLSVGRVWDREDRDREGTENRRGARIRDWVSLQVFLWLQPEVSQGRVPGPEAAAARAESGESNPRVQEGDRGTEAAGSRVAGGWQGDRKPEVARSGWVSQVGRGVKALGRRARVF